MADARIEALVPPATDRDVRELASLLVETVDSGAAVSFLAPLSRERAESWWRQTLEAAGPRSVFLVGRDDEGVAGTVQLHGAWAPNQPHRAEVVKLMVHPRSQGQGLGRRLMESIESSALEAGYTLLTLDAKRGAAAERLYRRLGWVAAGTIPRFAFDSDGTPHDAVFFYKELAQPRLRSFTP